MMISLKISRKSETYFAAHQSSPDHSHVNTVLDCVEFTLYVLTTWYSVQTPCFLYSFIQHNWILSHTDLRILNWWIDTYDFIVMCVLNYTFSPGRIILDLMLLATERLQTSHHGIELRYFRALVVTLFVVLLLHLEIKQNH